jgi:RNA polymerase sigma-70 factor (ECF subfamily)
MSAIPPLLDHLFRREAGRITASLCSAFGLANLDLAEEVVQDALLQALRTWPFRGVPENPAAWLAQTARNRALDLIRRKATLRRKQPDIERRLSAPSPIAPPDEIADEQLAMVFACCHPALAPEVRVALTLKAVCGFSAAEIARAFLTPEPTIAQRLVRAKARIAEAGIDLALPPSAEIAERLDSVLQVVYLLFNEGYAARAGDDLVRQDLCGEALRLGQLLADRPDTGAPKAHALLALMYLQASRFAARVDAAGRLLLLSEQDRSKWDRRLIYAGHRRLARAAAGDEMSEYHLQAGIAAVHAVAPSYDETDWPRLLFLYDQLLTDAPSPVVEINRAVVLAKVHGPSAGLAALESPRRDPKLRDYGPLHATAADLLLQLGETAAAAESFRLALAAPCSEPERRFLKRRLAGCG